MKKVIFVILAVIFCALDGIHCDEDVGRGTTAVNYQQTIALKVKRSEKEINEFERWKSKYKKNYPSDLEEDEAINNVVTQMRKITEFNARENETYKMDLQDYADQQPEILLQKLESFDILSDEAMTTLKSTTEKSKFKLYSPNSQGEIHGEKKGKIVRNEIVSEDSEETLEVRIQSFDRNSTAQKLVNKPQKKKAESIIFPSKSNTTQFKFSTESGSTTSNSTTIDSKTKPTNFATKTTKLMNKISKTTTKTFANIHSDSQKSSSKPNKINTSKLLTNRTKSNRTITKMMSKSTTCLKKSSLATQKKSTSNQTKKLTTGTTTEDNFKTTTIRLRGLQTTSQKSSSTSQKQTTTSTVKSTSTRTFGIVSKSTTTSSKSTKSLNLTSTMTPANKLNFTTFRPANQLNITTVRPANQLNITTTTKSGDNFGPFNRVTFDFSKLTTIQPSSTESAEKTTSTITMSQSNYESSPRTLNMPTVTSKGTTIPSIKIDTTSSPVQSSSNLVTSTSGQASTSGSNFNPSSENLDKNSLSTTSGPSNLISSTENGILSTESSNATRNINFPTNTIESSTIPTDLTSNGFTTLAKTSLIDSTLIPNTTSGLTDFSLMTTNSLLNDLNIISASTTKTDLVTTLQPDDSSSNSTLNTSLAANSTMSYFSSTNSTSSSNNSTFESFTTQSRSGLSTIGPATSSSILTNFSNILTTSMPNLSSTQSLPIPTLNSSISPNTATLTRSTTRSFPSTKTNPSTTSTVTITASKIILTTKIPFTTTRPSNSTTTKPTIPISTTLKDFIFKTSPLFTMSPKPTTIPTTLKSRNLTSTTTTIIPAKVDHIKGFGVVKNQFTCGSCYAFAAVALVEYSVRIKSARVLNLSEQCVVDCMPNSYGCVGGSPYGALEFAQLFGLSDGSPKFYEYKGSKGSCRMNEFPAIVNSGGVCVKYFNGNENGLKELVAKTPVVVGVTLTSNMLYYKSGIFSDKMCMGKLNHVLVVVGYDRNNYGEDYWIVRNSWGETWGMNGYGWFARNKNNSCGIASVAYYLC